ncbi:nuclease [Dermabacter sp. HMSC06F07]|uniref:nuclease n=1 Tax=Dermabacter TaxID=36739 RepID=UPI0008A37554|nr:MULTISPECIES: nuclease [Dermabacter]MDU1122235.1 VRR-NUC domain-containing protein [Dermabacter sp.]MCT1716250.1 VRR-NUC domain-containing protein [Dermabacter hominis]MCT1788848.1 VRR-NUC domain-containing protein [Dermabacter hominis]MCT1807743.1 VRR-NUC domain-containing protein [Dermabacter hominis]MDU5962436.1 VRR-NUC domain-containing protein [Dermabacter sp.]
MNEHAIEQHLKQAVEAIGGLCWKFTSPGTAGVPDRICIHHGRIILVELKAPGRLPRPIQRRRIRQLQDHGVGAVVVDSIEGIKEVADAQRAA